MESQRITQKGCSSGLPFTAIYLAPNATSLATGMTSAPLFLCTAETPDGRSYVWWQTYPLRKIERDTCDKDSSR